MTPEQIKVLTGLAETWQTAADEESDEDAGVYAAALRALLAEWEEQGRALDRAAIARGEAESLIEERGRMLDDLKTEAGRAAFALANGWPLPEELAAAEAEIERLTLENRSLHTDLQAAEARLAKVAQEAGTLCARLDRWWYEADPEGDIKKGDPHPWCEGLRAALANAQQKEESHG